MSAIFPGTVTITVLIFAAQEPVQRCGFCGQRGVISLPSHVSSCTSCGTFPAGGVKPVFQRVLTDFTRAVQLRIPMPW